MHSLKTYAIINIADLSNIDFSQTVTTSANTIRKSNDETQFMIKWLEGHTPTFINNPVEPVGIYDYHTAWDLMQTPEWKDE